MRVAQCGDGVRHSSAVMMVQCGSSSMHTRKSMSKCCVVCFLTAGHPPVQLQLCDGAEARERPGENSTHPESNITASHCSRQPGAAVSEQCMVRSTASMHSACAIIDACSPDVGTGRRNDTVRARTPARSDAENSLVPKLNLADHDNHLGYSR